MNAFKPFVLTLAVITGMFLVSCGGETTEDTTETSDETAETEEVAGETAEYTFDASNAAIKWNGKKVTGEHFGTIDLQNGMLTLEDGRPVSGKFVVDMTSIAVTDIEDEEKNAKLTGHLKSPDFFAVDSFNTATLVINSASDEQAKGELTIRGNTNVVKFPYTISDDAINAELTVDRTLYNVRYGSGKFFEDLGDKMIYDDFTLMIELQK